MKPASGGFPCVIVTYGPGGRLVSLVRALRNEGCRVLIFDNASTAGRQHLMMCEDMGAELLQSPENVGVAAGLNAALRAFAGVEWFFTFDQDSRLGPDFVRSMATAAALAAPDVAMIGPTVLSQEQDLVLQAPPSLGTSRFLITSGALNRKHAIESVGGWRSELFIDHVDHDVCLRLRAAGWSVAVADVPMDHSIGNLTRRSLLAKFEVRIANHNPDREYYKYRNFLLLLQDKTACVDRRWIFDSVTSLATSPFKILLFERSKLSKLAAIIHGTVDGLRLRGGPRPRRGRPFKRPQ